MLCVLSSVWLMGVLCPFTQVHPENEDWTCFEQSASLDIKSFFGFESTVEKIAMKQYTSNIKKGKEIIEYYLRQLEEEGITFVPRWTPPSVTPSSEISAASGKQAAASAIVTPEAALKEGPSSEALSSPGGAPEPVATTPDGGSPLRARRGRVERERGPRCRPLPPADVTRSLYFFLE